jgi:hypothetical protein
MLTIVIAIMASTPLIVHEQFPILPRDEAIVNDAEKRWLIKSGERSRTMSFRFPIVVDVFDERCVILRLQVPSVGVEPIYCYEMKSNKLNRFKDDLE